MKAAKFALCCLLAAISFAICSRPATVIGTGESSALYARADTVDIYFCREPDLSTALFAIPYTYCVRVLSTEGDWYRVSYADDAGLYRAVEGYCLKKNLTPLDEPPETVYLHMSVTLTLTPYAPTNGAFPVSNVLNVTAAFYGSYNMGGAEYSCLGYGDTFYYQLGVDNYPLNKLPAEDPPQAAPSKGANVKIILVVVLIAVAAIALLILYFTGRTAKFKRV